MINGKCCCYLLPDPGYQVNNSDTPIEGRLIDTQGPATGNYSFTSSKSMYSPALGLVAVPSFEADEDRLEVLF